MATTVEVTLGPGEASARTITPARRSNTSWTASEEWAIDDNPVQKLKAGDTFYEPTGCLHRVSMNPSDKKRRRYCYFTPPA